MVDSPVSAGSAGPRFVDFVGLHVECLCLMCVYEVQFVLPLDFGLCGHHGSVVDLPAAPLKDKKQNTT